MRQQCHGVRQSCWRKLSIATMAFVTVCSLHLFAGETVESVLMKPHFQYAEGRIGRDMRLQYYHEAYLRIVEADRAADAKWLSLKTPDEVRAHQKFLAKKMVEMIGGFPARTPLNPVVTGVVRKDGYRVEKVYFESRPGFFVTGHVFVPDGSKFASPYPAVLVPCGHSVNGKCYEAYGAAGAMGAKLGMVVLVYDPIDQGERLYRDIERETWSPGEEHNRVGWRCQILGWGAAQLHVWDAMRALDYLESRGDVDGSRMGVTGMSGGGTLSSYVMALDPRVKAGCPSGYITTLRDLCTARGPQDHEQNVQGMLSFGLNHLGYVLMRAPQPELLGFSHDDFFPIIGSLETYDRARQVYGLLGVPDAVRCFSEAGGHHWYQSTRTAHFEWLDQVLHGRMPEKPDVARLRKIDVGFEYDSADCGLGSNATNRLVVGGGRTMRIAGARSVYDVLREEADAQERARGPLTREAVLKVSGIHTEPVPYEPMDVAMFDLPGGVVSKKETLFREDTTMRIPVVTFAPPGAKGNPVLYLTYSHDRVGIAARVERFVAEGRVVAVADLRASGETWKGCHTFCGAGWEGEEELATMYMWLGENLVARRTEDALVAARHVAASRGADKIDVVAAGVMAVPAAHAFYLERGLFGSISFEAPCASWRKALDDPQQDFRYAATVYGAFRLYDWPDLVREGAE